MLNFSVASNSNLSIENFKPRGFGTSSVLPSLESEHQAYCIAKMKVKTYILPKDGHNNTSKLFFPLFQNKIYLLFHVQQPQTIELFAEVGTEEGFITS